MELVLFVFLGAGVVLWLLAKLSVRVAKIRKSYWQWQKALAESRTERKFDRYRTAAAMHGMDFDAMREQRIADRLLTVGNPHHEHTWKYAEWDYSRFGLSLVDEEEYDEFARRFPQGTYKELYRCTKCPAERLVETRALI